MATTTYSTVARSTLGYFERKMLEHAEPQLVLDKFGDTKPMPKNRLQTIIFKRPTVFATATSPLTEGVAPTPRTMTYTEVTATLSQYGDVVEVTDIVEDLAEDEVVKDAVVACGEQAASTVEELCWNTIKAGTNVAYANGSARTDVNTAIALEDLRSAVRTLKRNKAMPITKILSGSTHYNTTPVEGGYVAVGHSDFEADLRGLTGFTPVAEYGSRKPLSPYEIGTVENVRFILTPQLTPFEDGGGDKGTMVSTSGTKADVYPLIVFGAHFYGHVALSGMKSITPTVLQPNVPRGGDPLGQKGSIGWKTLYSSLILNDAWGVRIEAAVTAL